MKDPTSKSQTGPHGLSHEELAALLETDLHEGLSEKEASARTREFGPNEIPREKPPGLGRILVNQFVDPVILILVGAAVLAYVFEDSWQGTAIVVVIAISAAIGFFMESSAYRALEELRKLGQSRTRVIRSGELKSIRVSQLVPGDLVLLSPGDIVPADLRLVEVQQLSIKEAPLTGESTPAWKESDSLPGKTPLVQRRNMAYRGTTVMTGSGKGIVTATGARTELGKIQLLGIRSDPPQTPLEKKLKSLTIRLIWLTAGLTLLILALGILRGAGWAPMLETSLALAVAAIPEGLPIVATIALARGMSRLARRQVVVKNLQAIQTLGATDIILTDKTGTLTEDSLKVRSLRYGDPMRTVEAAGTNGEDPSIPGPGEDPTFDLLMHTAILCNNAKTGREFSEGDTLERALLDFARASGYSIEEVRSRYPEVWELPFDARRKLMVTVQKAPEGYLIHAKGAFEVLSEHCSSVCSPDGTVSFGTKERKAWDQEVTRLAATGLRTLAFAFRKVSEKPVKSEVLEGLVFLGVIGFMDPPRKDVRPVFEVYRKAGIRVVMVTGDHPQTALRISRDVGLVNPSMEAPGVFEGSGSCQGADLGQARVFARVLPEEKLDLVTRFQKEGHIVGMIGDGINDVPALKKADIGIAMGIRGTEAAREASDVILKDDSFGAIELAIRQGRVVFRNIRQFVLYLLSCNLAEILAVAAAALGNLPAPLLPLQILFLNLVTDVFPALALGLGRGPAGIMDRSPGNPKDPILNGKDWTRIFLYGVGIGISVLGVVLYGVYYLRLPAALVNNLAFYTLMGAQLLHVFNLADSGTSFFRNEITTNPFVWGAFLLSVAIMGAAYFLEPVAAVLELQRIRPGLWAVVLIFSLGSVGVVQLMKAVLAKIHGDSRARA